MTGTEVGELFRFIQGVVEKIKPLERCLILTSGEEVPYDVASFNTGSGIPTVNLPIAPGAACTRPNL